LPRQSGSGVDTHGVHAAVISGQFKRCEPVMLISTAAGLSLAGLV
jgi:3-oxoacyl-[acyl-carrier-protein] synthase-3